MASSCFSVPRPLCRCLEPTLFGYVVLLLTLLSDRSSVFDTDAGHSLADASAVHHATEELEKDAMKDPKPDIAHVENGHASSSSSAQYLPAKTWAQGPSRDFAAAGLLRLASQSLPRTLVIAAKRTLSSSSADPSHSGLALPSGGPSCPTASPQLGASDFVRGDERG